MKRIFWVFERPVAKYHIKFCFILVICFPSLQLFQNLTAFPCLTTSLISSSRWEVYASVFLESVSLNIKREFSCRGSLSLSSALMCFQKEDKSSQPWLCTSEPLLHTSVLTMHSILYPCVFPLHLFVFSLSLSKCGSLALYTLLPDEIVVMCNENDISCLDWQYMIQQISLLYSASCWHPKSPDTYTSLTSSQLSTQDTPVHGKNSF